MNYEFFTPTQLYKEYRLLNLISNDSSVSQRSISKELGIAVSMVNMYLSRFEENGLLKRKYNSKKDVLYVITDLGKKRKETLNIFYLNESQKMYNQAKEILIDSLSDSKLNGLKNVILYGAGEIAEILLSSIQGNNQFHLNILAIIDDDKEKQGLTLLDIPIISIEEITKYEFDSILISTFAYNEMIYEKLKSSHFELKKITTLFGF